jgi:aspartyl-tRNA(Asn)/glutamyl-tRNA(Gln) amidotransferase subunit B
MNSFRFIERGIEAEVDRQIALLEEGGQVEQETLHFDPRTSELTPLRSKEEAHDYRYFPEPDLVPVEVTEAMVEAAGAELPELPAARATRFQNELGLHPDTARMLAFRTELGDYFEAALAADGADAQPLANWVTNELVRNVGDRDPADSNVSPEALSRLVTMVEDKTVTADGAKQVLERLVANGGDPATIVASEGLGAMGDGGELAELVARAIEADPDAADQVRGGNMKAIGALVGAVMRETRGRADGGEVTRLIREHLGL